LWFDTVGSNGAKIQRKDMTIVIITRERCDSLDRTLDKVGAVAGVHEVIVVDNATQGCSVSEVCRRHEGVRLISLRRNYGPAARNIGANAASTTFIAFCDDDSWWEQDALARVNAHFEAYPRVALITGKVLVGPDERLDSVSANQAVSPLPKLVPMPGPAVLGFLACAAIVRTEAFLGVGGYSPLLDVGGEEALLAIDLATAGWGLTFADDVIAHHFPAANRSHCDRQRSETRNAIWVAWMRRPMRSALRVSLREIRRGVKSRCASRGIVDSLSGLPRVVRHRQLVPPEIEAQIRLLESQED
jgi:N-acetylglucosaminyl-diphospho-decaprenol L-rhamnosyltransferase